jgi:outer membrane lipoprotein SlyB
MGVGSVQAPAPFRAPAPTAVDAEEEFRAVRQSSKMKAIVLAAGTAVVGGLLGFAVGGLNERNSAAGVAVAGAKALGAEIDEANKKVVELEQVVTAAGKALKDGKYPDAEVKRSVR